LNDASGSVERKSGVKSPADGPKWEYDQNSTEFPFSPPAFQALPQTSIIQERNAKIGAAMSLLKKCDVNNCLPASGNKSRHSFWPVRDADKGNTAKIKPGRPRTSRLTFIEDFILEHSLCGHGQHITASEFLGFF
jgi:hypothetical protein